MAIDWNHSAVGREYRRKYIKKYVSVHLHFNEDTDKNILQKLDAQPNKTEYVRNLIQRDIDQSGLGEAEEAAKLKIAHDNAV